MVFFNIPVLESSQPGKNNFFLQQKSPQKPTVTVEAALGRSGGHVLRMMRSQRSQV